MKSIVKFLAVVLVFTLSFSAVQAQRGQSGRDSDPTARAENQTARMKKDLGLSDEQAEKIKAINLKYAQKAEEKREQNAKEREKIRTDRETMREDHQKEVESLLTNEQKEKWSQIRQERKEKADSKKASPGKVMKKGHRKGQGYMKKQGTGDSQ